MHSSDHGPDAERVAVVSTKGFVALLAFVPPSDAAVEALVQPAKDAAGKSIGHDLRHVFGVESLRACLGQCSHNLIEWDMF